MVNTMFSDSDKSVFYSECQRIYKENYIAKFKWLPERIEEVTSEQIKNLGTIYGITGVDVVTPFLKLRQGIARINSFF